MTDRVLFLLQLLSLESDEVDKEVLSKLRVEERPMAGHMLGALRGAAAALVDRMSKANAPHPFAGLVAEMRANRTAQDAAAEVERAVKVFEKRRRRKLTTKERQRAADFMEHAAARGVSVTVAEALRWVTLPWQGRSKAAKKRREPCR